MTVKQLYNDLRSYIDDLRETMLFMAGILLAACILGFVFRDMAVTAFALPIVCLIIAAWLFWTSRNERKMMFVPTLYEHHLSFSRVRDDFQRFMLDPTFGFLERSVKLSSSGNRWIVTIVNGDPTTRGLESMLNSKYPLVQFEMSSPLQEK